ncbi:MAG: sulfatase-like hydrolase/transferase, partial [Gammaproteobacteria bacterium]
LGLAGHPVAKTPHIDRIGREGAWFKNFFTVTPLCSPSRASFLTGLYPHSHRIINNDKLGLDAVSHTLMTWPRQLREAGYETAFIGKWHMGLDDSRRPGFDRWVSFKGQGIYIDGVVNEDGVQRQLTGYMTDYLNEQALAFVVRPRNRPFALVLSHKAVHAPYLPAARDDTLYADHEFTAAPPANGDLAGKPAMTRPVPRVDPVTIEGVAPEPGEPRRGRGGTPPDIVRDQLRCLASVDEGVGRLYAALAQSGQLDRTVFVYTSDNGYLMGEHGVINQKRWAYEPSIRVPLLVRYPPAIPAAGSRDQMVLNIDLAPTLLELAGVKSVVPMHGESFVPHLREPAAPGRKSILTEYFLEKVVPRVPSWQSVRTDRWKYIRYTGESEALDELYDLHLDPREERNLIAEPSAREQLSIMRRELNRLLAATK